MKRRAVPLLCLLVVLDWSLPQAAPAEGPPAIRYRVDAAESTVVARVPAAGLLSVAGHAHRIALRQVSGQVILPGGRPANSSLHLSIQAADVVETADKFSDAERKQIAASARQEVLEAVKHPTVEFRSTAVGIRSASGSHYQLDISGDLTLHGVTRHITVPTDATIGESKIRARGTFPILHGDYSLKRLSALSGTVIAGKTITMEFDIMARR